MNKSLTYKDCMVSQLDYRIAQNSGRGKLWQINHFRVLAMKPLANLNFYPLAN